jgi:hypothetical protein
MPGDAPVREATCLCGACTATTTADPVLVTACSCIDCQRKGGSAFGYNAFFPEASVSTRGDTHAYTHRVDGGRSETTQRCAVCGSPMWFTMEALPGLIGLRVGSFAVPTFPPPDGFYFTRSKHHWLTLPPDLPQSETL